MLLLAHLGILPHTLLLKVLLEESVMLVRSFVIVVIKMGQENVILQVANLERYKYREQKTVLDASMDVLSAAQQILISALIVGSEDIKTQLLESV